jgi:triosephosphate isomerase
VVLETVARDGLEELPARFEGGNRPLVVANWKMNMLAAEARDYARRLDPHPDTGVEVVVCPPAVLLPVLREALGPRSPVGLGAQDLHPEKHGAHTGEHGGPMLADAGARYVIVGHSERRAAGEDDEAVRHKLAAARRAGLVPILCVGERLAEREAGATLRVLRNQVSLALAGLATASTEPGDLAIAYEPVWAIGTGRVATAGMAQEALAFVRERVAELFSHAFAGRVRLLYGGSVNADNAEALAGMPDVDGFLVGGAGLCPDGFSSIIRHTGRARAARIGRGA